MNTNSTKRFSKRVEDYVKYRPSYPGQIISFLQENYALSPGRLIADIGSGTGISSELFLKAGYQVIGVEPNADMRRKAEQLLAAYPGFRSLDAQAENTRLEAASVDVVIAGQAFHWFDRERSKAEFRRILKPDGLVILLWNERKTASDFEKEYDDLIIRHARDYVQVDHRNIGARVINAFFSPRPVRLEVFANGQIFDLAGLKGRLLSSSYMPARDEEGYEAMIRDLEALFDRCQRQGSITIHYDTKVYIGRLD